MTAYEAGWIAAETGKTINQCPYLGGQAIAWRNGYRDMLRSVGLA